jgi:glycerophosphoryl diester phosphodiesterase
MVALENTLSAFEKARSEGVPAVELDIQLSSDEKLLVFHDGDLQRLAGRPDRTASLPGHELSSIELSGPPRGLAGGDGVMEEAQREDDFFTDVGIPLLAHVVETLSPEMYIDIEIKSYDDTPATTGVRLTEFIRHHNLAHRVMVSSFDPRRIWAFRRAAASLLPRSDRVLCAAIYAREPAVPWYLRRGQGRFVGGGSVRKPSWKDLQKRDRLPDLTVPWTVNDETVARSLRDRGAAGIIGDNPAALMKALRD